jgi:hypothetical protein
VVAAAHQAEHDGARVTIDYQLGYTLNALRSGRPVGRVGALVTETR